MSRDIVRQDQYGRLTIPNEIPRYSENEIGVGAIHLGQKFIDHLQLDFWPPLDQFRTPTSHIVVVEESRHLRPKPARLCEHARNDTVRCALQQVPDEGTANTETHHYDLVDAEVIHQSDVVIGV